MKNSALKSKFVAMAIDNTSTGICRRKHLVTGSPPRLEIGFRYLPSLARPRRFPVAAYSVLDSHLSRVDSRSRSCRSA